MLELCFNASLGGDLIYINSKKKRNGEKYNDVLPLDFRLDCGNLINGVFSKERFKYLKALSKDKWMGNEFFFKKKNWENAQSAVEIVKKYVNDGENILIWLQLNPKAICDFLFIVSEIGEIDKIKVIVLTDREAFQINRSVSYEEYFKKAISLTNHMYDLIIDKWKELLNSTDLIRVYVDGKIKPAKEDYYDEFICENLPDDNFVATELIYNLRRANICFGTDDFMIKRVCKILRSTKVNIVGWKSVVQSPLDLYEQVYCKKV